jgi:hypothetical protein
MNPPAPSPDPGTYVAAVVILYVQLPETPFRASIQDQWHARRLYDRGVPLRVVESAFLLASLRRLCRSADGPPLSPIRSLAYYWKPSFSSMVITGSSPPWSQILTGPQMVHYNFSPNPTGSLQCLALVLLPTIASQQLYVAFMQLH